MASRHLRNLHPARKLALASGLIEECDPPPALRTYQLTTNVPGAIAPIRARADQYPWMTRRSRKEI
jgi:hypothetical protein